MNLLNNNFLNFSILFGAIQGFTLGLYVWQKRKINSSAFTFFILFLFSLAYFNLDYVLIFIHLEKAWYTPIIEFPIPYKYLIGVGVYFYIKNHFPRKDGKTHHKREWYLFMPAILYELIYLYWYSLWLFDIDRKILIKVYYTGFFAISEMLSLTYNLILAIVVMRYMITNQKHFAINGKSLQDWKWLKLFLQIFLVFTLINFTNQVISLFFDLEDSVAIYASLLIVNSLYIYCIGFVGYTKSQVVFKPFQLKRELDEKFKLLDQKLTLAIKEEALYKNPTLKIADLAKQLNWNVKELSAFINEQYKMNFSEYMNYHRVEEVKRLLESARAEKYTLLTIANESGFSSKSSFNATFKKMTGLTPKEYKEQLKEKRSKIALLGHIERI